MQYCSLQHQTLLLSLVTSTTVYCFCFDSVSSFFLELFLQWSPVAYWAPTDLGSSSYLFAFLYCSWGSQGKNTDVVCHSLLQFSISICESTEECATDTVIYVLWGGTWDSVTDRWRLIHCLNCYLLFWPNCCYFYHYIFTSFRLILEPGFCDSGEAPRRLKPFSTNKNQVTWKGLCTWESPCRFLLGFMTKRDLFQKYDDHGLRIQVN